MKAFDGFKSEKQSGGSYGQLPVGVYVAGIKNVKIEGAEPDQSLILRLDIVEGEYAGYYTKRFQHDSEAGGRYEAKYKGDYRLRIPNPANTKVQHPEWDVKTFNGAIWAIESSNPGYHWDWNEQALKGKFVGINVREGTFNDVPYTTIGRLESAEEVRQGKVKPMKPMQPRYAQGYVGMENGQAQAGFTEVEDVELPF